MKFIVAIFFFILIACSKKSEVIEPERINIFTNNSSKIWILNNITTNGRSIIENCAKDDEYEFIKSTQTINYNPVTKCYTNDDPKVLSFQISTDQKSILIDGVLYEIDQLSNNRMILSHDGNDGARVSANNGVLHAQQTLTLVAK